MDDTPPAPPLLCYSCGNQVAADAFFCPHCGKPLKESPLSTSVLMLSWLFFLSVFLPPLGLWPGIKYYKHSDPKTKRIGLITIVLTILSTVITVWLTFKLMNTYVDTITNISDLQ